MGLVANAVKLTATGVSRVMPGSAVNGFARNASTSLGQASRNCPVISELGNVAQGIAQGDFTKAAVNTGILTLAVAPGSTGSKLAGSSKRSAMRMGALLGGNQAFSSSSNARSFSSTPFQKAVKKPLPYPMNGLEPVVSQNLMEYHYGKHHTAYVTNFNALQEKA